jgi:Na+/H+ antiporter NhaD/arsenite permease-like protein
MVRSFTDNLHSKDLDESVERSSKDSKVSFEKSRTEHKYALPGARRTSLQGPVLNNLVRSNSNHMPVLGAPKMSKLELGSKTVFLAANEIVEQRMEKEDKITRSVSKQHIVARTRETVSRLEHSVEDTVKAEARFKHSVFRRSRNWQVVVGVVVMWGVVLVGSIWKPHERRHDIHVAHMHNHLPLSSPLYAAGPGQNLTIPVTADMVTESPFKRSVLEGEHVEALEIKLAVPSSSEHPWSRPAGGGHRMLQRESCTDDLCDRMLGSSESSTKVFLSVLQDDKTLMIPDKAGVLVDEVPLSLRYDEQAELFLSVDLLSLAEYEKDRPIDVVVKTNSDTYIGLLCEVKAFGWFGSKRVIFGGILFMFTFVAILAEKFHRIYATFLGSFSALCMVALIYDRPDFGIATGHVDFGTLGLLYAMMANVHILATTGFFQWAAARAVIFANGNVKKLFYCLTISTGFLSMFLDNVTTVMLFGPVTISIAKEINRNPVPFYLAETICATIGGTATLIGDPPNVVIGNVLKLDFFEMIVVNLPLVIVLLFTGSFILSKKFPNDVEGNVEVDVEQLKEDNPITDPEKFKVVAVIFAGIILSLFCHPIHHKEAAWFMLVGEFILCMLLLTHNYHGASSAVEYDTLLFFAMLFVLVECLAELGVIRTMADGIVATIKEAPIEHQPLVAQMLILVVSCYGSAFLESLPYTACMCSILKDLGRREEMSHISVKALAYALSVGACVGGIGSIMGSSANLVCISISERYSGDDTPKVTGSMFLKHGLPVLHVCTILACIYQYFFFIQFDMGCTIFGELWETRCAV